MSVLALVFQNFVNCGENGVFLMDHLVLIQCVYTYHQNMKLLLTPLYITYQERFPVTVCD